MFFSKKKNDEQPAETLVPEEDAIAVADITLDADEAIETEAGEIEITQPSDAVKAQNAVEAAGRGAVSKRRQAMDPKRLEELFSRVNSLLGGAEGAEGPFRPVLPESLEDTGLTDEEVEKLVFRFLLQKGAASGREICNQIKLPFSFLFPLLKQWKQEQLLTYKNAAEMGDYIFAITENGRERARRYVQECTYCGAAPVPLLDYLKAMEAQTIAGKEATEADLHEAFSDLLIDETMFNRLGPAINSGRGMFLFGEPGNGKTSIAERITKCFGDCIWIPRTLGIDGDIIRLYDPGVHEEVPIEATEGLFDLSGVDPRWIRIVRPTIVAGGELTMAELEVAQNTVTKICEAPLQLKSNCGTFVIDDFGRQTMPVDVLLNRWIVPLEKRYDFLSLPSGKKIQVPFDQLIIFSTNLEPNDLVDGAFLRRIPYKICVPDPCREHFVKLFDIMAPKLGLIIEPGAIDYLIDQHYIPRELPFRNCQPRDLLLQVKNFSIYRNLPKRVTPESLDFAVDNYFSMM
ncbi:MAG: AAA family ATPase [Planctomycetaceae bacterium]|nr:AAA family ATPase [Planctomycetaceae bacterium]MCB9952112.1 AAA family ATPase [Planctomycetaceae bacterium]